MLSLPRSVHLASGAAEGPTPLNAFDNALFAAGVGDLNLVRVSSIVPAGATFGPLPELPAGTLTPTVYTSMTSNVGGETISACVGAGVGTDGGGVLMEHHHSGPADAAERVVTGMIEQAFARRDKQLASIRFATATHRVDRLGCAVAVAVLSDCEPVGTTT